MPARPPLPVPQPPAAALSGWPRALLLSLCAILLLGLFSREIYDSDFWWHLRTGQYIVEQHALPIPDPFAWTTATAHDAYPGEARTRQFNLTHEWLAQAIFYAVWRAGGSGRAARLLRPRRADRGAAARQRLRRAARHARLRQRGASVRPRPPLPLHLPAARGDAGHSRIPPPVVAAAAAVCRVGKLSRRLLPGMGGAGRMVRGIGRAAAARRRVVDRKRTQRAGIRTEPQRLRDFPHPAGLPGQL